MAIEKIIYRAATCNMGDTTEQDGDKYRAWAESEIRKEYPDATIEVRDEDGRSLVYPDYSRSFAESDDEALAAEEFLCELWDRCPWSGEYFD